MKSFLEMTKFEIKMIFRNRKSFLWTLLFPLGLLVLFYFVNRGQKDPYGPGKTFIQGLIPIVLTMNIAAFSLYTLCTGLVHYREAGILRRYLATPLQAWKIIIAQMIAGMVLLSFSSMVTVFIAILAFGARIYGSIILFVISFMIASFTFFGVALVVSLLVTEVRAASNISAGIFLPMLFLSGVSIPYDRLPHFLQFVNKIIPLTYVAKVLQASWYPLHFTMDIWLDYLILFVFGGVLLFLAIKKFRWE